MSATRVADPGRILVVDDEANMRAVLSGLLEREGYAVETAADGAAALEVLARRPVAVVLSDLRMPGMDGLELLARLREERPETPVLLLTAHGSIPVAVEAMRQGAFDFVTKPFDSAELLQLVGRAVAQARARGRDVQQDRPEGALGSLLGDSTPMQGLRRRIQRMAAAPSNVLVLGETGTGKELVARALHQGSARADGPFVATNCAAIPETLVEAELFGHEKGAFSGALASRPGRFELADAGTLFLDEVGDMSPSVQPKLLRALEQREVQRVGGREPKVVDVRFVAAAQPSLLDKVQDGTFREDLYYRIGVLKLELPPLRERREDIPLLVEHFRCKHQARLGVEVQPASAEVLGALQAAPYPGNVRELENLVEAMVVMAEGGRMRVQDLPAPLAGGAAGSVTAAAPASTGDLKETVRTAVEGLERELISRALAEQGGNVTRTAEALGLSRKGLQLKMKDLGLRREGGKEGGGHE